MSPAEKIRLEARLKIRSRKRTDPEAAKKAAKEPPRQPCIVKNNEPKMTGIRSFETTRCVVGYVLAGHKYIYSGDKRHVAETGDVFFLGKGRHYIEDVPAGARRPFQQLMFFFDAEQAGRLIALLNIDHNVETQVKHTCPDCSHQNFVIEKGWDDMKIFFETVDLCHSRGIYTRPGAGALTSESLTMMSLFFNIIDRPECCLRTIVLASTDPEKELMERQINEYIFSDITLEDFARLHNRSITSFKKKFREYFHEPPHRWVTRQRLMHARMRLLQTDKTVSQIGFECRFPNTSHFIKLFRQEFGMTPAVYRQRYRMTSNMIP